MTAKGAVLSEAEKEKSRIRAKAYYHARKNNPAFKAKRAAQGKAWAVANPEKVQAWRDANKEYLAAYGRSYLADPENKERARVRARDKFLENRALITSLKAKPCMDCGIQYPYYVMQFDHRPDEIKTLPLSDMYTWGTESILAEAAKCDVVCANCHAERSQQRLTCK